MKAKDVMIPLYDFLQPNHTIKDAINLLRTAKRTEERVGVKGAPVLDEKGRLLGILSMSDILRSATPKYLSFTDLGLFTWEGMLLSMAKKVNNLRVKDIMEKDVKTVREETSLMACVDLMLKHRIKRLPVIDKNGKVIGMIYERDIFFAFANKMLEDIQCYK